MRECAKVKRALSRYLDKEASDADIVMVERHIADCYLCRKELFGLNSARKLVLGVERKSLPQDYLVSRLRGDIARVLYEDRKVSLAGMGSFARKLIPVPVAAIIVSAVFLIFTYTRPVIGYSLEDHIFSGASATSETALELILDSQN